MQSGSVASVATGTSLAPRPGSSPPAGGFAPLDTPGRRPGSGGPRRIAVIGLILIVVTLISATIAAIAMSRRVSDLDGMLGRTEPLATAAEDLYAALSQADASAASAFLSGGLESPAERDAYDAAIANAAGALATAASGVSNDRADQQALAQLATQLPVYTGLVDTARANNRLGLPVGAAYLREASGLMRTTLLPAAQTLYASQAAAVGSTQNSAGAFPWWQIALGALILLAILIGQSLLARTTRRRLNLGLLVALAATLGWVIWLGASGAAVSRHLADSRDQGSQPLGDLAQARILAQQARTDETLYLIARGSGDKNETDFKTHSTALQQLLSGTAATGDAATATAAAQTQATQWIATHQSIFDKSTSGDYPTAVSTGIGTSATQFRALDASLQQAISDVRQTLRDDADAADSALNGLVAGIVALAAIAAIATAIGLWPRLREYQ